MTDLPPNVYRVTQRRFDAIPGSPWVYWVSDNIRDLFESLPKLGDVAEPRVGLQTVDNARFLRYWWEVGPIRIGFGCRSRDEAQRSGKRWFPYMKGGTYRKWFGNQEHVVNWYRDGQEIRSFYKPGGRLASRPQNTDFYFREGVTWTDLGASGFSARISPGGFVYDVSGSCAFPTTAGEVFALLAVMNADSTGYLLSLLNPTMHFQVGDLARLPLPHLEVTDFGPTVGMCVRTTASFARQIEPVPDYVSPPRWDINLDEAVTAQVHIASLEAQNNDEVRCLYDISDEYWGAIVTELGGRALADVEEGESALEDEQADEPEDPAMAGEERAARWISYALGIVLGRFQPGFAGALGSAVYRRSDFAIGSLPEPDEAEFNELVGPPERFAYTDPEDGRHVFSAEVEAALHALAVPDGITVLDECHPRDLVALAEQALRLMLDGPTDDSASANRKSSIRNRQSDEVIQIGAGGDLRDFLSRDFFTKWHFRWYRKRPVYWPLQSARRSYGFVLFHECIDRMTLYTLQRDYLDVKLNALRLQIDDLRRKAEGQSGAGRKRTERQIEQVAGLLDEVNEFAKAMARIVAEGYEPEPNWIDDGVILRMAPLWELIPIWKAEPRKYWERLQKGDFDWSHIAMRYWPERVKAACKTNKSFAIAHGHEEWYEGE